MLLQCMVFHLHLLCGIAQHALCLCPIQNGALAPDRYAPPHGWGARVRVPYWVVHTCTHTPASPTHLAGRSLIGGHNTQNGLAQSVAIAAEVAQPALICTPVAAIYSDSTEPSCAEHQQTLVRVLLCAVLCRARRDTDKTLLVPAGERAHHVQLAAWRQGQTEFVTERQAPPTSDPFIASSRVLDAAEKAEVGVRPTGLKCSVLY